MDNKIVILGLIALAVVSVAAVLVYYNSHVIFKVVDLKMDGTVMNMKHIGFNIDSDAIHFSKLPIGGESQRIITIDNHEDQDFLIRMKTSGNISAWVTVSDNNFIIHPDEEINVTVIFTPDGQAEYSYYDGVLSVIYERV